MAVSEVLSTTKGTTFYVLTVAGEHGVPEEKIEPKDEEAKGEADTSPTFRTENEAGDTKPSKPAFISSVDVDEDFVVDIKKK